MLIKFAGLCLRGPDFFDGDNNFFGSEDVLGVGLCFLDGFEYAGGAFVFGRLHAVVSCWLALTHSPPIGKLRVSLSSMVNVSNSSSVHPAEFDQYKSGSLVLRM